MDRVEEFVNRRFVGSDEADLHTRECDPNKLVLTRIKTDNTGLYEDIKTVAGDEHRQLKLVNEVVQAMKARWIAATKSELVPA